MAGADNIYNTTQNFLTPEYVQRFSTALGQPDHKVQSGLRSVIPTFLSGLISKGSTPEGAEEIVHLVETENFDADPPVDFSDKEYLTKGEHAVEDIFGKDFHSVTTSLTPETGLTQDSLEKMMEMIAPVVLGVLNNKIKDENMTPDHLSGFLQQQRKVVKGFVPAISAERKTPRFIKEKMNGKKDKLSPPHYGKKKTPFGLIVALALIFALLLLWTLSRQTRSVATLTQDITSVHTARKAASTTGPASIDQLPAFLAAATLKDLPGRFLFQELSFIPGTTDLSDGGDLELDFVAETLMSKPGISARIDAYIENTGDTEENLLLSENRAMLVREELIGRGVEPSSIRAHGRGGSDKSGQIELVITRLK